MPPNGSRQRHVGSCYSDRKTLRQSVCQWPNSQERGRITLKSSEAITVCGPMCPFRTFQVCSHHADSSHGTSSLLAGLAQKNSAKENQQELRKRQAPILGNPSIQTRGSIQTVVTHLCSWRQEAYHGTFAILDSESCTREGQSTARWVRKGQERSWSTVYVGVRSRAVKRHSVQDVSLRESA